MIKSEFGETILNGEPCDIVADTLSIIDEVFENLESPGKNVFIEMILSNVSEKVLRL